MRLIASLAVATALGALAAPASAQDSAWNYTAILYAWVPSFDTSFETVNFGTIQGNKTSNDLLGDLNFAFMGTFEAQKGRFTLAGDLIYASVSMSADTPKGALFSEGVVKTDVTAVSGYGLYRISTDPAVAFDLGVGFRAFSVDATATVVGNKLATQSVGGSTSWVDPLVAARLIVPFNDKWSGSLFGDVGGSGGGSNTWQLIATVDYKMSEAWSMNAGYRYMSIEKDIENIPATIELSGPVIGVSYRF